MIAIELRYFAALKPSDGRDRETLRLEDSDARALYGELQRRYGWRFDTDAVRLAVNGRLVAWEQALADGDEVAFLPPFSGG